MAYSLDTGLFYVPSNEWGMDMWNEPVTYKKGAAFLGAGFTIKPLYQDHIGVLRAVDPKAGKIVWEYKNKAPLWSGSWPPRAGSCWPARRKASSRRLMPRPGRSCGSSRPARA